MTISAEIDKCYERNKSKNRTLPEWMEILHDDYLWCRVFPYGGGPAFGIVVYDYSLRNDVYSNTKYHPRLGHIDIFNSDVPWYERQKKPEHYSARFEGYGVTDPKQTAKFTSLVEAIKWLNARLEAPWIDRPLFNISSNS